MAIFCIPRQYIEKLQNSALKSAVDLEKLYEMDSKERREFFSKFTDKETGKFLNTKFEQAVVSKQQNAMLDWAKSVFTPAEKAKPRYKNVLDKIANLEDLGVLNDRAENAFLEDLVTEKLGVSISPEEMANITEKAKKVEEAQKVLGPDLGNPAKTAENVAYFKAVKEINDYMQSVTPANRGAIATGVIGRGMMLFSIKSPVLNIGSNLEIGFTESLARRLSRGTVRGADNKLALDYMKMARKIYKATGFDVSRMTSINDLGASGERVLGDTIHTQGPGMLRKSARVVEDIVFKNLMGAPDAAFASAHFADSVNLQARELAGGDKAKAKEFMEDAMRITPTTPEGQLLRAQAILDAEVATWTNDTWASKVSLSIRKIFNDISGDLRIGDYLMPFVKTPANVIATGMDYAGLGIPKALYKFGKMIHTKDFGNKEMLQSMTRDLVRAGLGITAAAILAANTDDDDFAGVYDPGRAQLEKSRNSVENSFRLGDRWISTDWLGPIAVPYNAIMYARKYGQQGPGEMGYQYASGVLGSAKNLPGIKDAFDFVSYQQQKQNMSLEEMTGAAGDYIISQASSRLVPSIFTDVAKAFDPYERQTSNAIEAVQAKTPGARNLLPEKRNIFGDATEAENPLSIILFGSRVKTSKEDAVTEEINSVVTETEKNVNFTDWAKSSSKKLGQFREHIGEERFKDATIDYGHGLKKKLETLFASSKYREMDADKKLAAINALDADTQEEVFDQYNFKYTPEKKK